MNSETIRVFMSYLFALVLVGVCFWFLYLAFLDPNTFGLPQEQQNVVVAGIFGLLGSASTYVFTQSSAGAAARQSERASAAGANAAMSTPAATVTTSGADTVTTVTPNNAREPEPTLPDPGRPSPNG